MVNDIMGDYKQRNSIGSVAAYQVSSIPYCSASIPVPGNASEPLEILFPYISKFVTIKNVNASTAIHVGFSAEGITGSNYISLSVNESYSGEWKVAKLYVISSTSAASTVSIVAGLTNIAVDNVALNMYNSLTGSII